MLSRTMYTSEYIGGLYKKTGNDPTLLERVVYAFGLLEAIKRVGLPFCFKGGTALMLLFDRPRRLSTDIDIIVEPGTDIDEYIRRAGEIFPFLDVEEHVRVGKNDIEKRHFKFKYRSPRSERNVTILLDVMFEKIQYKMCILKPIKNELLLTEGEDFSISIPNVNGILGDKMTAFAPHTMGIPFGVDKELEVIRQLYDCAFNLPCDYVIHIVGPIVRGRLTKRSEFHFPNDRAAETAVKTVKEYREHTGRGGRGRSSSTAMIQSREGRMPPS